MLLFTLDRITEWANKSEILRRNVAKVFRLTQNKHKGIICISNVWSQKYDLRVDELKDHRLLNAHILRIFGSHYMRVQLPYITRMGILTTFLQTNSAGNSSVRSCRQWTQFFVKVAKNMNRCEYHKRNFWHNQTNLSLHMQIRIADGQTTRFPLVYVFVSIYYLRDLYDRRRDENICL